MKNMGKPSNFIFIGRSGSGKGTQAKFLLDHLPNMVYISTGDLMRDLANKDTDAGHRIKSILDNGGLPFDDMATTLWMHKIAHTVKEEQGIICDGFPRRNNEAQNLDNFFEWLERKEQTKVLLIDISREEAIKRLKLRGRYDDIDEEDINNRLNFFEERVVPAINHYKEQNRLISINGEQSREEVFQEILKKIK